MEKLKAKVVQDDKVVEKSILAQAIVDISKSMKKLLASGITLDAVLLLVQHNCRHYRGKRPTMIQVKAVIQSLVELEKQFCK